MNARADIVGQVFGRLTVEAFSFSKGGRAHWLCRCSCGTPTVVATTNLTGKHPTRSCGCLLLEKVAAIGRATRKHGEAAKRTPEYIAWRNIQTRCHNPNAVNKKYYSEMGVVVCERWRASFENFLADMGRRPSDRHSIDRFPDPNGNYEPANCRWADPKQQRHNRRPAAAKGEIREPVSH